MSRNYLQSWQFRLDDQAFCEAMDREAALIALRSSPPVGRTDASQSKVEGETKQSPNPQDRTSGG